MMKYFTIFFFLILSIPTLFAGNKEITTYKIGCNKNYYPYITINENTGKLEGLIIEWWDLWGQKKGVQLEYVSLSIDECIEETSKGNIDAIAGLFYSEERAKQLSFSEPLLRMETVVFVQKGEKVDSIQHISQEIGILNNDLAYNYLANRYPTLRIKTYREISQFRSDIKNNKLFAFVYDLPHPLRNTKPAKPPKGYNILHPLFEEKLRVAVKKGNDHMLNEVVAGAADITDDDVLELANKYDVFQPDRTVFLVLLICGIVFGVIIGAVAFRLSKSRRRIKELENTLSTSDVQLIIDKGETDFIEFKSSLRWDYRQDKPNKALEKVIAKTISAFLNSKGGMLLIGVNDQGNILGLEKDYFTTSKKNRDGFLLALTALINSFMGKDVHKFLNINIITVSDKDVCILSVEPSNKPVFIGSKDKEEFYIRASASSQPLGVRETYNYIQSKWN